MSSHWLNVAFDNTLTSISLYLMQLLTCKQKLMALEALSLQKQSLQRDIEIAQSNALELEQRSEAKKTERIHANADKLALIDKFGYEEDDEDASVSDTGGITNREHTAVVVQNNVENAKKIRSNNQQTKKEARAETAKNKADRNAKKEERRKRATKGERRR